VVGNELAFRKNIIKLTNKSTRMGMETHSNKLQARRRDYPLLYFAGHVDTTWRWVHFRYQFSKMS